MTYILAVFVIAVVVAAVRTGVQAHRSATLLARTTPRERRDRSGWVYFITVANNPDAPIKVGMSQKDPAQDRLTELRTMSPFPLRIVYKLPVDDRFSAEASLHEQLDRFRMHGEWFEREPTLAFIDYIRSEGLV